MNKDTTPEFMAEVAMYAIENKASFYQTADKFGVTPSQVAVWVSIVRMNLASLFTQERLQSEFAISTKRFYDQATESKRRSEVLGDRRKSNTAYVPKILKPGLSAYYSPKMELESAWTVENNYDFCFIFRQKERWIKGATKLITTHPENSFYICIELLRSLPLLWQRDDIKIFLKPKRIGDIITQADKMIICSLQMMDYCQPEYDIAIDLYKTLNLDLMFVRNKSFVLSEID